MNISTIQAPSSPQVSWSTVNAQEKDADFLRLRLLNKRMRVRISPQPLDLNVHDGKGNYFVISNTKGWFAAISRTASEQYQLSFSPLTDLRDSVVLSKTEGEDDLTTKRAIPLAGAPVHLTLALNDERLVVGFADSSISVYDTTVLFTPGAGNIEPLRTFPPVPRGTLRQILGNPGDLPELVAVRRDSQIEIDGLIVEIIDVRQLQSVGGWRSGGMPGSLPTSIVWSVKGKQLAIGLRNGNIVTYSPTDTSSVKLHVPKPPSVGDSSVISVLWLSNQAFYGIYAPPDDLSPEAPQKHVLTLYDAKTNSATQTELETPYYASPALRPPGSFIAVMRNWIPAKVLVFIGDSTSSDIGLVGSIAENDAAETWCNLTLEETSTPSVPLDKDAEDTVPLALDVDLTSGHTESVSTASPILYLYASDGTLQAWFISNEKGGAYPGMVIPSSASTSSTSQALHSTAAPSPFSQPATNVGAFGSAGFASATPMIGQTSNDGFVSPSLQPEQAKSAFAQTTASAFGSSAFGQQSSTSAFGQPTAFGKPAGMSAVGQPVTSGFGAFASSTPKFGSPGFGFGNAATAAPAPSGGSTGTLAGVASPEAEMSEADAGEADKLGGLSLGGTGELSKSQDKAANSMFGSFGQTVPQASPATSAFDGTNTSSSFGAFGNVQGSGFLKPATGFGAFLKPAESPSTPEKKSSDNESKAFPAFGSSSFGTSGSGTPKTPSALGPPAFGQSSFGASTAFGKPSAFSSTPPVSTSTSTTSGGFGAFSGVSKGFSAFAQGGATGFGQQAQSLQSKPSEAPSISMASSTDDLGKGASPTIANEQKSPSPFGTPTPPSGTPNPNSSKSLSSFESRTQISPFGGGRASSPSPKDQKQSAFSTPIARGQTPTSSPEGTPRLERKSKPEALNEDSFTDFGDESFSSANTSGPSTTPFGTPAPSVFRTTGPVPTGGAFGNLTTTPSAFKPAQGWGAFGASTTTPSSSPFANPKPVSVNAFSTPVKPVSAFGAGGSGPSGAFSASPADSTTPKFGTPSTPSASSVFGKSSFGTPVTPSPASTTPLATPKGNAFGAYSGSGGFSAFAKTGKPSSFSDLLKSQKDEDASPPAVSRASESKREDKEEDSSFVSVSKPEEGDQDNLPPTPSTHGTFDEEEQDLGDDQEGEHDDASSFLSESFSERSSEEPEEEEEKDSEEDGKEDEESGSEGGEKPAPVVEPLSRAKSQSPASIPLRSTSQSRESTPEPASNDKNNETRTDSSGKAVTDAAGATKPLSPTPVTQPADDDTDAKKPTAPLKSPPSTLAKPNSSGIPTLFGKPIASAAITSTSPSPPPSLFGKQATLAGDTCTKPSAQSVFSKPISSVRQDSTTPPGSPSKPGDEQSLAAPKAVRPASFSSTPLGLGLPGSRPARSSPLAGSPLSGEDSTAVPSVQTVQTTASFPKARPASPKVPFGQIPGPSAEQNSGLSNVIKPEETRPQSASPLATGAFALPPKPPQFSVPAQISMTAPPAVKLPSFGTGQLSPSAGNAPFIMPTSVPVSPGGQLGALGVPTAQQASTQTVFESSMQRECQLLCVSVAEELKHLVQMSQGAYKMRIQLGQPTPLIHGREHLGDKTKWSFGDLEAFGRLVKGLEKDVLYAYKLKDEFVPQMRVVESNLLKAETRKEETIRFSKAKADTEFAKMLKARTLGPDAAETQSQLRRQIRLINDRVEQLEAHLKSCKKKLEEYRKGKSSIKPPSLDTINRIFRNIDVAVESQTEQIETLTSRVTKLNIDDLDTALHNTPSPRRKLSKKDVLLDNEEEPVFRPQVTASIAASTAAALNAERSALRLKNALHNARKVPLLNTQAIEPVRLVPALDKSAGGGSGKADRSKSGTESELQSELELSLDSLRSSEQDVANESQRRPLRHSAHAKSVKLGKTHTQVPASIATFDWGPLPKAKPMAALPFSITDNPDVKKIT